MKTLAVALIIAHQGYQPIEYGDTKKVLEEAGITVTTVSDKAGTARAADGKTTAQVDKTVHEIKASDFDGIFLIGGGGAMQWLDTSDVYKIMQDIARLDKPFGAICISPFILAKAGVLKGKRATVWAQDKSLMHLMPDSGATYVQEDVVVDGHLVTAPGPWAAKAFGEAIVQKFSDRGEV